MGSPLHECIADANICSLIGASALFLFHVLQYDYFQRLSYTVALVVSLSVTLNTGLRSIFLMRFRYVNTLRLSLEGYNHIVANFVPTSMHISPQHSLFSKSLGRQPERQGCRGAVGWRDRDPSISVHLRGQSHYSSTKGTQQAPSGVCLVRMESISVTFSHCIGAFTCTGFHKPTCITRRSGNSTHRVTHCHFWLMRISGLHFNLNEEMNWL